MIDGMSKNYKKKKSQKTRRMSDRREIKHVNNHTKSIIKKLPILGRTEKKAKSRIICNNN